MKHTVGFAMSGEKVGIPTQGEKNFNSIFQPDYLHRKCAHRSCIVLCGAHFESHTNNPSCLFDAKYLIDKSLKKITQSDIDIIIKLFIYQFLEP